MGDDEGTPRLGVPLSWEPAASLCSWAAAGSGGELGIALRWDVLRGVAD
jgi:hypothetical protein